MDRNSPSFYIEETGQGIADVESLIDYVKQTGPETWATSTSCLPCAPDVSDTSPLPPVVNSNSGVAVVDDLVTATIIPRFVPSTTSAMMHALGRLSSQHNLPVHSHLSESPGEIEW